MSCIVLIAPGDRCTDLCQRFQKTLARPHALIVKNAYMENAVEYARHQLPPDTDVIISRGNTAALLKASRLPVPVVTIAIRDSELIRSIEKAKALYQEKDSQIAYIGLEDTIQSVRHFLEALHHKIRLYPAKDSRDIEYSLRKAKQDHVNVVIGGVYTQKLAEENGLKAILLESSLESVRDAYDRALEIQKGAALQRRKMQERLTMVNAISDALVGINKDGLITLYNTAAERAFGEAAENAVGKPYSILFPEQERLIINRMLLWGAKVTGHVARLRGEEYSFDFHPVLVRQENSGVIISFRPLRPPEKALPARPASGPPPGPDVVCRFSDLIGGHPAFLTAKALALSYARTQEPVLLIGEPGTGRTAFARCIHAEGGRGEMPFLVREAALLSLEDLLSAHGGTLFLRDIEDLPPAMVPVLLSLLEGQGVPLPDHTHQPLDVRLIAGTSQDLAGRLPSRLYYALGALPLPLPALRQRGRDCALVFSHLWSHRYQRSLQLLPPDWAEILCACSWPGNLRQLSNLCRRLQALTGAGQPVPADMFLANLEEQHFYAHLGQEQFPLCVPHAAAPAATEGFLVHGAVITHAELRALDRLYQGHRSALAKHLGVSRSTLWRYFKVMESEAGK